MSLSEDERKEFEKELKKVETEGNKDIAIAAFTTLVEELEKRSVERSPTMTGLRLLAGQDPKYHRRTSSDDSSLSRLHGQARQLVLHAEVKKAYKQFWPAVEESLDIRDRPRSTV